MTKTRLVRAGTLALTGLISFVVAYTKQADLVLASVMGNAGVLALFGAVWQLFRDEAAHQKVVWLQQDDQGFQVGATSHMANTVFDKHVAFSEEYVAEVQKTIDTLVRSHATEEALSHANNLFAIRRKHATWVTTGMSEQLEKFEQKLRSMGAQAHFVAVTQGSADAAEQRSKMIDSMFAAFEEVLPEFFGRKADSEVSAESMIQRVRCMLGIEELVDLRSKLIARAHKALQ